MTHCRRNNIGLCGGGTHAFHRWPERRICPGERFDAIYQRYGYLAKQFTVFGQRIHVGVTSADEAIWLTRRSACSTYRLSSHSAASPFVDGVDTLFQSARLNAVSAFPLSGQCPPLADWHDFLDHFRLLPGLRHRKSIKDLYWDVRPNRIRHRRDPRVRHAALGRPGDGAAALAQSLCRYLLRERPGFDAEGLRRNRALQQVSGLLRYGPRWPAFRAWPAPATAVAGAIDELMILLDDDASHSGCSDWLHQLADDSLPGDARWRVKHWSA